MRILWSAHSRRDIERLYDFLALNNQPAAERAATALIEAPRKLAQSPRIGQRLEEFEGREVRHIHVGPYEVRYEVAGDAIHILRIWHGREER